MFAVSGTGMLPGPRLNEQFIGSARALYILLRYVSFLSSEEQSKITKETIAANFQ